MRLHFIMACHNRRELTLRCLKSAHRAVQYCGAEATYTIFDDGSTDGTAQALLSLPFDVRIIPGDGTAFWAKGMAVSERVVLLEASNHKEDYLVWINDDVELDLTAFAMMEALSVAQPQSVLVGAVRDPESGWTTYSGMRRAGLHPLKFSLVQPSTSEQMVQAFNGNFVMVPFTVARHLGGIDGAFSHAFADIDYGLRCSRAGIPVLLAPGTFGTCARNPTRAAGAVLDDWRAFIGAKGGGNFASLRRILRKTNGAAWPLLVASTYSLWWFKRLVAVPSLGKGTSSDVSR